MTTARLFALRCDPNRYLEINNIGPGHSIIILSVYQRPACMSELKELQTLCETRMESSPSDSALNVMEAIAGTFHVSTLGVVIERLTRLRETKKRGCPCAAWARSGWSM